MKLGVSTLFCLSEPSEETVRNLKPLGIHYVELADEGAHALNPNRVKYLKEVAESYGWKYSVHSPFAEVNMAAYDRSMRRASLRRLEQSLQYAAKLEAVNWVFHPGAATALDRFYPGEAWKRNLESVKRLRRLSEEFGVEAVIENVPEPIRFLLKSVEDFERFYSELDEEIGMVFDVAHANIMGEIGAFLERFGDRIVHVHVSDNLGDQDTHLPIGRGVINWRETIGALKKLGFNGMVIIESYSGIEESLTLLRELIG